MSTSPLAKKSNPFTNALTPTVRSWLYLALTVAAAFYAAYQANDEDWKSAIGAAITALLGILAASNASPTATTGAPLGEGGYGDSNGLLFAVLVIVAIVILVLVLVRHT